MKNLLGLFTGATLADPRLGHGLTADEPQSYAAGGTASALIHLGLATRMVSVVLAFSAVLVAQMDPREIVRQSIATWDRGSKTGRSYSYTERDEQRSHGGDRPPTCIRPLCGVFTPHSRPRRPYTSPAPANVPKDTMLTSAPPINVPTRREHLPNPFVPDGGSGGTEGDPIRVRGRIGTDSVAQLFQREPDS